MSVELFRSIYSHAILGDGGAVLLGGEPATIIGELMTISGDGDNPMGQAISGRIYYGRAPQGTPYPYIVYFGFGFLNDDTFDAQITDCQIQFNCYSENAIEAFSLLSACRDRFDGAILTVTGHESVRMTREMQTPPFVDGADEAAAWKAVIEFTCKLQKGE